MHIPEELLSYIFSFLRQDKATLSACSLTGKSRSLPAQQALFYSLHLTTKHAEWKPHPTLKKVVIPVFDAFFSFMRDHPTLASSVQELRLTGPHSVPSSQWDNHERMLTLRLLRINDAVNPSANEPVPGFLRLRLADLFLITKLLHYRPRLILEKAIIEPSPLPPYDQIPLELLDLRSVTFPSPGHTMDVYHLFRPCAISLPHFGKFSESDWNLTPGLDTRNIVTQSWAVEHAGTLALIIRLLKNTPFDTCARTFDITLGSAHNLPQLLNVVVESGAGWHTLKIVIGSLFGRILDRINSDTMWWDDYRDALRAFRGLANVSLAKFVLALQLVKGRSWRSSIRGAIQILTALPMSVSHVRLSIMITDLSASDVLEYVEWEKLDEDMSRLKNLKRLTVTFASYQGHPPEESTGYVRGRMQAIAHLVEIDYEPAASVEAA